MLPKSNRSFHVIKAYADGTVNKNDVTELPVSMDRCFHAPEEKKITKIHKKPNFDTEGNESDLPLPKSIVIENTKVVV